MAKLTFKNTNQDEIIYVNDLGISCDPQEDLDLIPNFRNEDLLESVDLETAMNNGAEVTLNDTDVLSYQNLIDYLTSLTRYDKIDYSYITSKDDNTDITSFELEELTNGSDTELHNHSSIYYSKQQLSSPGESTIDWQNIVNAPSVPSITVQNGEVYFTDTTRNKLLSMTELSYTWSDPAADGKFLRIGLAKNVGTGYVIPKDATVTKLGISISGGFLTKEFDILSNNNVISTISLSGGIYISDSLNLDINQGDILQIAASATGGAARDIVATVYLRWRT